MPTAKIRLKFGAVEVDYEGDSAFLEKDLLKLVQDIQKIAPAAPAPARQPAKDAGGEVKAGGGSGVSLTTKSIATKLGVKTASELCEAACVHLAIIKNMPSFKRSEINDAMKTANGIYNVNMSKNLSGIINTLLSQDTLVETGSDTYAMTPEAEAKFKGLLGIG